MQLQISLSLYFLLSIIISVILIKVAKFKLLKVLHIIVGLLLILIAFDYLYDLTLADKLLISVIEICVLSYWILSSEKKDSSITNPASW